MLLILITISVSENKGRWVVVNLLRTIVIKRDGREEPFNLGKLRKSIEAALSRVGLQEETDSLLDLVVRELDGIKKIRSSELADRIERCLISKFVESPLFEKAARAFILGRIYNQVFGKGKWENFDEADFGFTYSALRVMQQRYLLKDVKTGRLLETPKMMIWRVASSIASAEEGEAKDKWAKEFFRIMIERRFLPNSPTLMNAGTKLGILSACFVLPVRDAMTTKEGDGIYDAVRAQAIVFQQGGGCGFNFSELRPKGDVVASTAGVASGPLSFMRIFDVNTDVIKQGGRRRGANMGVLHVWHPDIRDFIKAKTGEFKDRLLQNFNISVGMYDYFMKAMAEGKEVPLINPRKTSVDGSSDSRKYAVVWARHYIDEEWVQQAIIDELERSGGAIALDKSIIITWDEAAAIAEAEGAIVKWEDPEDLFDEIVKSAWEGGDPGLLFIDTINRRHPTWYLGKINATNPCGEEPLLEWESCNLGSINLEKYVIRTENTVVIDWEGLARDVRVAVRFLDNVITVAKYPIDKLGEAARRARKIGLGVMGWAHMLVKLSIPYDSPDAAYLGYMLSEWIAYNAYLASIELAKEKGPFPAWNPDLYMPYWETAMSFNKIAKLAKIGEPSEKVKELVRDRPPVSWEEVRQKMKLFGLRNAALLSIAPTGTISIIAGTSSSIEPVFALAFTRVVTVGTFIEVNPLFLEALATYGLDDPQVVEVVAETGSIAHNPFMPRPLRNIFKTAHDIEPKWHVVHQSVWQQWVDAGVSKTVNLRNEATVDDVREIYLLAWALGCKGITVYRDRSKSQQVIHFGVKLAKRLLTNEMTSRDFTAEDEEVRGAETIVPPQASISSRNMMNQHPGKSVKDREYGTQGTKFRVLGISLPDGDAGDCKTCEY